VTLLVVGASGLLGGELCRQALAAGQRVAGTVFRGSPGEAAADWHRVDLRERAAVRDLVLRVRPTAVVNCAYAYDDWAVCADAAGYVAVAAVEVGARLVHISTDALHGGRAEPYPDDAPPTPITAYGAAKAAGETAVRTVDPAAAIVRTSLIIGDEHSKQVRLCLDLVTGRVAGHLFADEVRCPVAVEDLASAVLELVQSDFAGRLNIAGPEAVSRPEMGRLVARRYGVSAATMPVCTVAESGLVRPAVVRLDTALAGCLLRTRLRGLSEVLAPVS
jgi:dTDP-4-dehydrorhamnose reductase